MNLAGYAVIPDGGAEPSAVFRELDDAIAWGLRRHGGDRFRIRHVDLLRVESAEARRPSRSAS